MDSSLALLLLLLVALIVTSLGWCFLSSCMGRDVIESVTELYRTRYTRPFGEEMWEMERRRGPF